MTAENEVRITLTDVFERMEKQGKEFTKSLSDQGEKYKDGLAAVNTTLAVLIESNKAPAADVAKLKIDVSDLQRKVWALPSLAAVLGLASLAVAVFK